MINRFLHRGDMGDDVLQLQIALVAAGIDIGKADSDFGVKTETGLKKYQSMKGLKVDGEAGPATFGAMGIDFQLAKPPMSSGFSNKMVSRSLAVGRYGGIDFASKHWPQQGKWIQSLEIPAEWFPSWHVLDSKAQVRHIACNLDIHMPLLAALKSVHERGLGDLLKTFDGCFNIRMVRGSTAAVSAHSYGLALDINASENGLGQTHGGFYNHLDFVKCFTEQGFAWGGNFHGRKDPMHFSYCWEG